MGTCLKAHLVLHLLKFDFLALLGTQSSILPVSLLEPVIEVFLMLPDFCTRV